MEDDLGAVGNVGFGKHRGCNGETRTLHLYAANCGPAVGLALSAIEEAFASFGEVTGIRAADDSGTRVVISFQKVEDAVAAKEVWSGQPCDRLQGRIMHIQYAVPRLPAVVEVQLPAMTAPSELQIPGLAIYPDFVSIEEEQFGGFKSTQVHLRPKEGCGLFVLPILSRSGIPFQSSSRQIQVKLRPCTQIMGEELLAAVSQLPWQSLARRRVQHYGYEFLYKSRNVDLSQKLGNLPIFVGKVVDRISSLPELTHATELSLPLDQLTVNEYPGGVGLSPHIDTHSAFEGSIISLSLSGPCVMELRRYPSVSEDLGESSGYELTQSSIASSAPANLLNRSSETQVERKRIFLPERSLLILSDEARYAWHHYIPHHKVDQLNGQIISRGARRVSFTFRKVRSGSCQCKYVKNCDSQILDLSGSAFLSNVEKTECLDLENSGADLLSNHADDVEIPIEVNHQDKLHLKLQQVRITDAEERASSPLNVSDSLTHILDIPKSTTTEAVGLPQLSLENTSVVAAEGVSLSAPEIEKRYVHKVYDAIAPHFSATRFAKWPKVALFLNSLAPGSLVADSGCGNGKYLGYNTNCVFIGCDISPPLIAICSKKDQEALVADALQLPYRTGFYDAAISIAVLHHLSNEHRRKRSIEELLRVVRSGGKVLITVWAREQEDKGLTKKWTPLSDKYVEEWVNDEDSADGRRHGLSSSLDRIQEGDGCTDGIIDRRQGLSDVVGSEECSAATKEQQGCGQEDHTRKSIEEQQEYFVPWHLPYHRAEVNGAAAAVANGLARKDDKKGTLVYNRYYHMFAEGELERLAAGFEGAEIIDRFYDKSNWCIILQKL